MFWRWAYHEPMSTKSRFLPLLLTIATLSLAAPTFSGCGTPPERKAFSLAVGTRVGIETAVAEFKVLVKNGKVKKEDLVKARQALKSWQAADDAYLVALDAVGTGTESPLAADQLRLISDAAYNAAYRILVIYVPNLDPNPPSSTK